MATKKVAAKGADTAASHDRCPTDSKSFSNVTVMHPNPVAKKPTLSPFLSGDGRPAAVPVAKKPAAAVKVTRKPSIQTVQTGLSSRKETDKTVPYVLLRKPTKPGGKSTRQIVNLIRVGDTADASHVRSMRVCTINGRTFGTNISVGLADLRKARFFDYSNALPHNKSAKTVQPWDLGNDDVVRALEKLGAITKYELEFHLEEAARRKHEHQTAQLDKANRASRVADLQALKTATRAATRKHGALQVRAALRACLPSLF